MPPELLRLVPTRVETLSVPMLVRLLGCALLVAASGVASAGPLILAVDPALQDNGAAHRTQTFRTPGRLVLRRGAAANVAVDLGSAFDPSQQVVEFVFTDVFDDGDTIVEQRVPFVAGPPQAPDQWFTTRVAEALRPDGSRRRTMRIAIPSTAAVGEYMVGAVVRRIDSGLVLDSVAFPQPVVLLMNPWSPRDTVFFKSEAERVEYVLAESGTLYAGNPGSIGALSWIFGQFDRRSLDVALALLDGLDTAGRRSPARIARHLAAKVNADDFDAGLLGGSWDTATYGRCYRGKPSTESCWSHPACDTPPGAGNGRCAFPPSKWLTSGALFDQFLWRGPDVRWAQCWVFAGTLTTLLRGLGLPSRPVTGFSAGVDVTGNGRIDFYLDADRRIDYARSPDRVWNFHVWVESWMRRPDLPAGRDGWQALDATPQVRSAGLYRLGPTPLASVRAGGGPGDDVAFVLAQVDGDVRYWVTRGGIDRTVSVDPKVIGQDISTKAVGTSDRIDVTNGYKATVASAAARLAALGAPAGEDVRFDLSKTTTVPVGAPVEWSLRLENLATTTRTVEVALRANAVSYDGTPVALDVAVTAPTVLLAPGEVRSVALSVPLTLYRPFLDRTRTLEVVASATVLETDVDFVDIDRAGIEVPELEVTASPDGAPGVGEERQVTVRFTNPLGILLDGVVLRYEIGSGATVDGAAQLELQLPPLAPGETKTDTRTVVALAPGSHLLAVALESTQLTGVRGGVTLTATAPPPAALCGPAPAGGCRIAAPGASKLSIRRGADASQDRLAWKWTKGEATDAEELLDPIAGSPVYRLCLYDESAAAQPLRELDVPPRGVCGKKPCWKRAKSGTLSYKNPLAAPDGVMQLTMKPGLDGKAVVKVAARGPALGLPALPLAAPITVQLLVSSGRTTACWQTTYQTAGASDEDALDAKGP